MSGTVIFLGAGASKPLNYPLTYEILPLIVERLNDKSLFNGQDDKRVLMHHLFDFMFPACRGIADGGGALWQSQLPLITDVLSLLDHMRNDGVAGMPGFGPREIAQAREALEQAIFEVLVPSSEVSTEGSIQDVPSELLEDQETAKLQLGATPQRPASDRFTKSLEGFIRAAPRPLTVISTNYDVEVDSILFRNRVYFDIWNQIDFGFDPRDPYAGTVVRRPHAPEAALFKLHGSLNWLKCSLCGHVYVNPLGSIAYLAFSKHPSRATTCHCGFPSLNHLMVTPSFVRDIRDSNLLQVWRNALEALRTADRWYILGYSLPPEDIAIRSIMLRAYHGRDSSHPPEVIAVQRSSDTKPRFEVMFRRLEFVDGGIEAFLGN